LLQKGVQPVVIDRSSFAHEASWAGAGFLDLRSSSRVDSDFFNFCKKSFDLFPSWCEKLKKESGVDPEYVRSGSLDLAFNEEEESSIHALERAMNSFGEEGRWLSSREAAQLEPELSPQVRSAFFVEKNQSGSSSQAGQGSCNRTSEGGGYIKRK